MTINLLLPSDSDEDIFSTKEVIDMVAKIFSKCSNLPLEHVSNCLEDIFTMRSELPRYLANFAANYKYFYDNNKVFKYYANEIKRLDYNGRLQRCVRFIIVLFKMYGVSDTVDELFYRARRGVIFHRRGYTRPADGSCTSLQVEKQRKKN